MKKKTILIAILLLFAFVFNSCKKKNAIQEEIEKPEMEEFFQLPADISTQLKAVADDIKKQNNIYQFVDALSKRNGFPVWDKVVSNVSIKNKSVGITATEGDNGNDKHGAFLIPLKLPGGCISSYIACLQTDTGYAYHLYSRPKLEGAAADTTLTDSSDQSLSKLFVIGFFEKIINNKDSIVLAGHKYSGIELSISNKGHNNTRENGYWEQIIVSICVPKRGFRITSENKVSSLYCTETSMMAWVEGGNGGGGSSGGGNTGGGGGSTGGGGLGGNYQCPPQMWWCETGDYRIINGRLYTADNYPGKNNRLTWAWWESKANYQKWLNHDINIIDDLAITLGLTRPAVFWLVENPVQAEELQHLMVENDYSVASNITSKIVINLYVRNLQSSPYNTAIQDLLNQYLPADLNPSPTSDPIFWSYVGVQAAFIKLDNPDWPFIVCYWKAMEELVHGGLDIVGMVPVVGEIADLTNGLIYIVDGNGVDATLSIAAAIPIVGWASTTAKYARKTIYALDGTKRTLKWFKRAADGIIEFGDRKLLRKVLGLATGDAREAHHIIPWDLGDNALIQRLAKSKNIFHLNERYNGLALNAIQHNGSHDLYNERVRTALEMISNRRLSDDDSYWAVRDLMDRITAAINANPNTPINNLIF